MIITEETKQQFLQMLNDRQIIVIQCNKGSQYKTYNFKFIGANSEGKWDFTPMVVEMSGFPSNKSTNIHHLSVRALDATDVICNVIEKMKEEGVLNFDYTFGYELYQIVRDKITTFYI
jgi:hypothetical protein